MNKKNYIYEEQKQLNKKMLFDLKNRISIPKFNKSSPKKARFKSSNSKV